MSAELLMSTSVIQRAQLKEPVSASMMDRVEVEAIATSGEDVITWFEMHVPGQDPVPVANWAKVRDGKIHRVRVTFDPRPLLA